MYSTPNYTKYNLYKCLVMLSELAEQNPPYRRVRKC